MVILTTRAAVAVQTVPQYGRTQIDLPADSTAVAVEFSGPQGATERRPVFQHQPARFSYDDRGYEHIESAGQVAPAARFTPTAVGEYRWTAVDGQNQKIGNGSFTCTASDHGGYVRISERDPRYFATTDGKSFCVIGLNLCWVPSYALPAGGEFKTSGQTGVLGVRDYERWFEKLRANGGNFARLWVGAGYLQSQKRQMGQLDLLAASKLDAVVEAARLRGIRLKISLDSFRQIRNAPGDFQALMPVDPETGKSPADMSEFLDSPRWRQLWLAKVDQYAARYAGDPTVAVIEPWNEMNCVVAPWEKTLAWNAYVMGEMHKRFPSQLVANSLGSFDGDWCRKHYEDMQALDVQQFDQVHRYLDQGARYAQCHDPVVGSVDAIHRVAQKKRPALLAETGAVNDNHTGLFRFARWDDRGIIFHDTTFPAFFAGAAGTGQIWFWESYVDQKDVWAQYKALADLLEGVAIDQEQFEASDLSNTQVWCLALVGQKHTLLWLRNRSDTWQASLRDQKQLAAIRDVNIAVPKAGKLQLVTSCWPEATDQVRLDAGQLIVPVMTSGMMVRVEHR